MSAIIYEVNLTFKKEAFEQHGDWMIAHMQDMVVVNQFDKVIVLKEINLNPINDDNLRQVKITAQYYVDSMLKLQDYLIKRSKAMRDQVIEKFQSDYQVTRRVFEIESC